MYTVYFIDGTSFKGGDINDSKWNEMPKISIAKLEYEFLGFKVILEGFEAYNHLVEKVTSPTHKFHGILGIILMAKIGNEVRSFRFSIQKERLDTEIVTFGKEYLGRPSGGWKKGVISKRPKSIIL